MSLLFVQLQIFGLNCPCTRTSVILPLEHEKHENWSGYGFDRKKLKKLIDHPTYSLKGNKEFKISITTNTHGMRSLVKVAH